MAHDFDGEYECKLDSKSRLALPADLKRQLPSGSQDRFILKRGLDPCLEIYPLSEWELYCAPIKRLDLKLPKHRDYARAFYAGATELTLDSSGRLLLPKRMVTYARILENVVLLGLINHFECWDVEVYERLCLSYTKEQLDALREGAENRETPKPAEERDRPNLGDVTFPPPGQRH